MGYNQTVRIWLKICTDTKARMTLYLALHIHIHMRSGYGDNGCRIADARFSHTLTLWRLIILLEADLMYMVSMLHHLQHAYHQIVFTALPYQNFCLSTALIDVLDWNFVMHRIAQVCTVIARASIAQGTGNHWCMSKRTGDLHWAECQLDVCHK